MMEYLTPVSTDNEQSTATAAPPTTPTTPTTIAAATAAVDKTDCIDLPLEFDINSISEEVIYVPKSKPEQYFTKVLRGVFTVSLKIYCNMLLLILRGILYYY
jgi:hypothetical protein